LADSWIWARLQQLVRDVERLFQNFQYGQAASKFMTLSGATLLTGMWRLQKANAE